MCTRRPKAPEVQQAPAQLPFTPASRLNPLKLSKAAIAQIRGKGAGLSSLRIGGKGSKANEMIKRAESTFERIGISQGAKDAIDLKKVTEQIEKAKEMPSTVTLPGLGKIKTDTPLAKKIGEATGPSDVTLPGLGKISGDSAIAKKLREAKKKQKIEEERKKRNR